MTFFLGNDQMGLSTAALVGKSGLELDNILVLRRQSAACLQEAETNVAQLGEQVFQITGIPLQHQVIVIVEDRARLPGIFKMARKVQNSLTTSRLDLRSALISWVNFIFLPEVFNRLGVPCSSCLCSLTVCHRWNAEG